MKISLSVLIFAYSIIAISGCTQKDQIIQPSSPSGSTLTPPNKKDEQRSIVLISSPVTNIYKTTSTNSEKVTQALYGETVTIVEDDNNWAKVKLPQQYDYLGWVQKSQLMRVMVSNSVHYKIVSSAETAVYDRPSLTSNVAMLLPLGTTILANDRGSDQTFISVTLINGNTGFVLASQVRDFRYEQANKVSSNEIISTAKQLVGVPYLWGGMTNNGIDCSGFIHTVFKVNGIKLHRDADQQYANDGVNVDIKQIRVGDLLFFSTYKPGASHEGIYVGDDKFIHASSSQGVGYSSLSDRIYQKRLIGVKRVLN